MVHSNYLRKLSGLLFCLVLLTGFSAQSWAQFTVSGTVTDANTGKPLIGVNIFHEASGTGTTTDLDGTFSLELPGQQATLRISYIGYLTQNIEASATNNELNIKLERDIANLEEVVVTGLASSIKRENLANAVGTVSAEELTGNTTPQTIAGAMQGKIAGVSMGSFSGSPGGGFNIQLRGISTLGAGSSQPLFIIDGVYVSNATLATGRSNVTGASSLAEDNVANRLADINPEDIASIEVLKGPSAAAIYGQRANAGVIIITTKSGAAGETHVSVNQDIGFSTAQKFLGRTTWTEDRIIAFYDDPDTPGLNAKTQLELQRYRTAKQNGGIRDLERVLYGNEGLVNNTQISVSGGNEKTQFYVSGNFEQEEGIIKNTGFERRSIRANIDHNISEFVHVASHSNYIHTDSDRGFSSNQNNTGGSVGYTLAYTPNYAYGLLQQNPDGTYPDNPYFGENPFRLIDKAVNSQNVDRFLQSVSVKADLFKRGSSILALSAQGGLDYLTANSLIYFPNFMQSQKSSALPGDVIHSMHESMNINMEAVLSFNTTVKSGDLGLFVLGTQLGATRFDHKTELNRLRGQGLLPGQTNVGNASRVTPTQFFTDVTDVGFFGQQKINWDDKLIATVGARLDRSTLNLQQEEYYFYPKASLAANLPNFEFWPTDALDQFKLRVAYGETGGLPTFGNTFLSLGNANIGGAVGALASGSGVDPNLKPERARELEYGLDLAILDGRVSFSGTIYKKTVEDLILGLEPSPATGVNNVITNAAELENRGVELSLNVTPIQTSDFNWNATILWWKNETEITELKIPAQYNGFYFGATRFEEGVSPTAIFGTKPGVEGRVKLGNFQPDYRMSFANSMTFWGNLELSFFWDMSQGSELVNLSTLLSDGSGNSADYWDNYPELPARFSQGGATTRFLEDGSYIKLRELSLYYTIPKDLLSKAFGNTVRGIRVGVSGRNLLTITDYSGYDPEVNVSGRQTLGTKVSIVPYPPSRKLMFHVNLDF